MPANIYDNNYSSLNLINTTKYFCYFVMSHSEHNLNINNIFYTNVNIRKSILTIFHISIKQVLYVT